MFSRGRHISLCILLGVVLFLLQGQVHAVTAVISATGSVQDSDGNPVEGAIIKMVGDPYVTTTSDGNGDFTLNGLPLGATFAIEIIASEYVDLYSRNFKVTSNLEGLAYTLHTPFQLSGWGLDSGKIDIAGCVTDSSNNNLQGAVVSCTSKLHKPCVYTIEYGVPPDSVNTTATTANGSFYVLNVDVGDTVTVSASPTADWVFTPITFVTYADSESEGNITGSAATVPGAPTIGTATPGNAQATVTFTPPAPNGSSAITGYTLTSSPGGKKVSGPATAGSITVKGLTNGKAYTFTVTAANAVGSGPPSGPSSPVTPGIVPGAPTILHEKVGNGQVTVGFKLSTGTLPIKYSVAPTPPDHPPVTGSGSPITVTGLNNGTEYTFTATGSNATGTGPGSMFFPGATPATVPGQPTDVTATAASNQATVFFIAPADGGSPITSYTVTPYKGKVAGTPVSGPATAGWIVVKGLANGKTYTFTVKATNKMGTGKPSYASGPVTLP